MTEREKAILWLDSFVKNKEPMTLIPKQLIRLMHDVLKEQPDIVRCKECKWAEVSDNEHTWCDHVDHEFCHNNDWYCADGKRKET